MDDLTLTEAREALSALQREIGPKCVIYPHLGLERRAGTPYGAALTANVYPKDMLGRVTLSAKGETWRELLADCRRVWEEHGDTYAATTVREMALAIISITADQGECTDAALRATFDAADVTRFGTRACEQATEMASNGPFSIVTLSGANDAEAA